MPAPPARHTRGKHLTCRTGRARGTDPRHRKRWSADVTRRSDVLDIEPDVFKSNDPDAIAASLKRSAGRSRRRKASPFQSAMSMLNFYANRPGRNLPKTQRTTLAREAQAARGVRAQALTAAHPRVGPFRLHACTKSSGI